jgi:hypothetical protein
MSTRTRKLSNIAKMVIFTGRALWLIRTRPVYAQVRGEMYKELVTTNGSRCFSCCPKQAAVQSFNKLKTLRVIAVG